MIKLEQVIEGLEFVNDGLDVEAYYNSETKEIFYSDTLAFENLNEEEIDELFEKSIMLPTKYEIHEYSMMEKFIATLDEVEKQNQLFISIKGAKAFRRFKDTCLRFGIINDWYKFREEQYKKIAVDWCKENEIEFEE